MATEQMVDGYNKDSIYPSLPSGVGITETGIHPASGLRTFTHSGVFMNDEKCVAYAPIATTTTWKVLPLAGEWGTYSQSTDPQSYSPFRKNLPFPCTPCITYVQTNATPSEAQTFSVRITGRDQFGTSIREVILGQAVADATHTPGVPTAPYVRKTRLWCAKVFSVIERVEYIAACQSTDDRMYVGTYWDMDYSGNAAPYENYIGQQNQGVGTVGLINAFTPSQGGLIAPDLYGIELVNLDAQVFPIVGTSSVGSNIATYSVGTDELAITEFSAANPTVVTCTAHTVPANNRFRVRIYGVATAGKTYLNGEWIANYASATTFTIPANNASLMTGLTEVGCYVVGATVPIDQLVPTLIGDLQSPNPAALNAYHQAFWASSKALSPFTTATTAGTGGWIQVLRQPTTSVQAYNSALTLDSARGGFRLGTNASTFVGSPHKWNIYKAVVQPGVIGSSTGGYGIPLITSDAQQDVGLTMSGFTGWQQFPWPRGARIGFNAYYHTSIGRQAVSGASSYGHAP